VVFAAVDDCGNRVEGTSPVTIVDTTSPVGAITSPVPATCHGPAILPVTIVDSFTDICDADLTRSYEPGPGPAYGGHGDYQVVITARDDSLNEASDAVLFTIDTVPPSVVFAPRPERMLVPATRRFTEVFSAGDADGATGEVLHEVMYFDDCLIYDGATYGNRDGRLIDEQITRQDRPACRASEFCGQRQWTDPVIRITASDCGGNVGVATHTIEGDFSLTEAACGP